MNKKRNYNVVSLFTGCGGLDLGFKGDFDYLGNHYETNNFDIVWANDIDKPSCVTFEKNFGHPAVCGDITKILSGELSDVSPVPEKADVVVGGFPCQDFSLAGKRRGFGSERGLLYQSMAEIIKRTRPYLFVAENVKGILSAHGGEAIKTIIKDFEKLGYNITYKLYLVADFGVSQSRERVIIIGTDKERGLPPFEHIISTHKKNNHINLKTAIGDLEDKEEGSLPNHFWSKAKMTPGTQGNTLVNKDGIGPTMRSEHHGNIEWHWNGKRRLSAREAARIQSFPDDFIFHPSTSSAYKQIGNAVPPVFGWHIARAINDYLDKNIGDK